MADKKLYRYRRKKILAGVCTGFAEYFDADLVLVRLIWLVLAFTGIGIIAYIAAAFIIPYAPDEPTAEKWDESQEENEASQPNRALGIFLIALGVILLLYQFDVFRYLFSFHISWKLVWGLLLLAVGILLLFGNSPVIKDKVLPPGDGKKLYRPSENRFMFGVCLALAKYFGIDASLVRIFWVLATFASHGIGVFVYFILIIIIPDESALEEEIRNHE